MMNPIDQETVDEIYYHLVHIISETNGLSLNNTLDLLSRSWPEDSNPRPKKYVEEFKKLLRDYQMGGLEIKTLMNHPVSQALFLFFKNFPLPYQEDHIHLTGSLTADFIYPHLKKLLAGPNKKIYEDKITAVYGKDVHPVKSIEDVDRMIRLGEDDKFERYLEILLLPKLILTTKEMHKKAAYHMAKELYENYNVGLIRLKFTLSRETSNPKEQIPGLDKLKMEDVVLGLYAGFKKYQSENAVFNFTLSPSFRKESNFFDHKKYKSKGEHFNEQVDFILNLIEKHPELGPHLNEVDTVGNEKDLHKKSHFLEMKKGFRRLQLRGFKIRSHHGETWHTLRKGVQAVDNAMNLWHIETLEHGLSLGINPNYYFHSIYLRVLEMNRQEKPIKKGSSDYLELMDMDWEGHEEIKEKLLKGKTLKSDEVTIFTKVKFHAAREIEHYQHDVLNRMINKDVGLTALPSSNKRLTEMVDDHRDHPFSWWEMKGVNLGVGTDNYITLNTNYIQEMLILLYSNPENLKITKLLMITSGESRRAYIGHLLWQMRKEMNS